MRTHDLAHAAARSRNERHPEPEPGADKSASVYRL